MKRLSLAVCSAAVVVVLIGGCSSSGSGSSASSVDVSTTVTTAAKPAIPAGATYVALGSSFAAGSGIPVQTGVCGRSESNYPNLVAADLELKLVDVSCAGATTANVLDTPQGDTPPQINAVTADTKLVTVTAGGNDIGYSVAAISCGTETVCTLDSAKLETDLAAAKTSLTSVLTQVKQKAPGATVVLVTYPRVVPEGVCPALSFAPEEAAVVRTMGERLEQLFVEVGADTGVVVVDPYAAEGDHTVCAEDPANRWTDGVAATVGFPYHPNATGHVAMAKLVSEALAGKS